MCAGSVIIASRTRMTQFSANAFPMARVDLKSTRLAVAKLATEYHLVSAAVALGAARVASWSTEERSLVRGVAGFSDLAASVLAQQIQRGKDPLGEAFSRLRSPEQRREDGATYTPAAIVKAMVRWASEHNMPMRVVDPGVGSGRFLLEAGRRFPKAELIGIDTDPLAALMARGNLAAAGYADRSEICCTDFRAASLPPIDGRTLYIGNPPYVRHHLLGSKWKEWLSKEAQRLGHSASQLAGLHVHFFLATALNVKPGDFGSFITAAEWLDVNYGQLVRDLFLENLGGRSITVVEPTARPFADAASTAAITTFEAGEKPSSIRVRRVDDTALLHPLEAGRLLHRGRLETQARWSFLTRRTKPAPTGYVELGELCRVHRGQVTGANRVWIAGKHSEGLPLGVLFPTVTRARELFAACGVLADNSALKNVIDLPVDLSSLNVADRKAVEKFLKVAKAAGADTGYVAGNRKAWWSVGLRSPAPILATYMARRAPAFVRNLASARHINIAHGLYPREPLDESTLTSLAGYLSTATNVQEGRTYAGGLTKFEPREMERILVPTPELLAQRQ
jgi:adenine-specific DNA-methyltransferase